jgi:methylglyoxal reductase
VLERGLLGGKIGMDYVPKKGEARSTITWFADGRRQHIFALLNSWADLCEKYGCSMANLVIAFTLNYSTCLNVLFGARRLENLLDTAKSLDLRLVSEDIARMKNDIAHTLALCAESQE